MCKKKVFENGFAVRIRAWGSSKRLPIVSWGNGACARNGMAFAEFLTQIAGKGNQVRTVQASLRFSF